MIVDTASLEEIHPAAWNVRTGHDVDGIAESIRINGFRDPIEVWRETGEIVAGEGRYHAAVKLGLSEVPVIYHDFTGLAEAKRYGIANNRLGDKSEWDLVPLQSQLAELESLAGTGFDDHFFAVRPGTGEGVDPAAEWEGMPEFKHEDKTAYKSITLHFKDQEAVDEFAELVGQEITPRTRFLWYPEIEIESYADKRYADES